MFFYRIFFIFCRKTEKNSRMEKEFILSPRIPLCSSPHCFNSFYGGDKYFATDCRA